MIKVALISHSVSMTGAEKMLFSLAKILKRTSRYYPVIFYPGNNGQGDLVEACVDNGIETISFPASPWYVYENDQNVEEASQRTLAAVNALGDMLEKQGFGVTICNTLVSLVPVLASRKARIPALLWVHGILDGFFIDEGMDLERRILFDRINMALSSQVICCSKWVENYYSPICESPICTVGNWSEDPKSKAVEGRSSGWERRFICLNTFDRNKGVLVLLKAVKILKSHGYKFTVDLYGTGGEEAKLREFVVAEKLEEFVRFCGRTNEVDKVYENAFCLVNPSDLESFGLTITEAMSHSLPVIAVNSGGPGEIVEDGITGFLIAPRAEETLAEKMEYLLDNPDDARRMGELGRKRYLAEFSPEKGEERFLSILDKVLANGENDKFRYDLLESTLLYFIHQESAAATLPAARAPAEISESTIHYALHFSGSIRRRRAYNVHCAYAKIKGVELIAACHEISPPRGMITVRLRQRGALLGESTLPFESIPNESRVYFPMPAQLDPEAIVTVEICPSYTPGSGALGLYEDEAHRPFFYKVFNKLGHPLKGRDALIARFFPED